MRTRIPLVALSTVWLGGFAGLLAWWFASGSYLIEILWIPWSLLGAFGVALAITRRPYLVSLAGAGLAIAAAASLGLLYRYEESVATSLAHEVAEQLQINALSTPTFELSCPARDPVLTPPTKVELRDFDLGSWIFVLRSRERSVGLEVYRGHSGNWRGQCFELPAA